MRLSSGKHQSRLVHSRFKIGGVHDTYQNRILTRQQLEKILNFQKWYQDFIKLQRSTMYFGDMIVQAGDILKEDLLLANNFVEPTPLRGFKVLGENFYRSRKVINL